MKTINFSSSINMKLVDDMLITALEGGSNYWYLISETDIPEPKDFKRNEEVHYTFLDKVYQGAVLEVQDIESEDLLGTLSMATIESGLKTMQSKYPNHYSDMITENYDADTADVFFQCCIMNEIVYG